MKNLLTFIALCGAFSSFATSPLDSAQFYYSKGMEEKIAQRYLVASQYFEKATSFNPTFADAYVQNGYTYLEMHKLDDAKAAFTKAYAVQPTNADAIKNLTQMYFDYRQWDKAIQFASKCTDCANSDRIVGMCNYEKEDYGQAEKFLLKAIAKSPQDAPAQYTLARTYIEMQEEPKAVSFFEKAVSLSPEKADWSYELGLLYYNNEDFKNAVKAFENASAHGYIETSDYNENYGYALLYSGQFDKGEAKLMGILQKNPGKKDLIQDIAQILYEKQQYNRSLDYCQKMLEMDANNGKAMYQAGLDFQKLGQKDKGQGMCDKAIQMDPSLASHRTKSMDIGAL